MRICFPSSTECFRIYSKKALGRGMFAVYTLALCLGMTVIGPGGGLCVIAAEYTAGTWEPLPSKEETPIEGTPIEGTSIEETPIEEASDTMGVLEKGIDAAGEVLSETAEALKEGASEVATKEAAKLAENVKEDLQEKVEEKVKETKRNLWQRFLDHVKKMFQDFFDAVFSEFGS